MNKNLLIMYLKDPKSDKAKTRLAKDIGKKDVSLLYEALIRDSLRAADESGAKVCLSVVDNVSLKPVKEFTGNKYIYYVQKGDDIGKRMFNSFEKTFSLGYEKVIVIGSDCPEVSGDLLKEAFDSLDDKQAVIGPALDGGYYLIGFKKGHCKEGYFDEIEWSTEKVFEQTLNKIDELDVAMLTVLGDVDTFVDLERLVASDSDALKGSLSLLIAKEILERR